MKVSKLKGTRDFGQVKNPNRHAMDLGDCLRRQTGRVTRQSSCSTTPSLIERQTLPLPAASWASILAQGQRQDKEGPANSTIQDVQLTETTAFRSHPAPK
jgi:hypothetical protein